MLYYYIPPHGLGLIAIHKCASSTIDAATQNCGRRSFTAGQLRRVGERVAFIREPHDRLISHYRMIAAAGSDIPFEEFVIEVCADLDRDPHTRRQSSVLAPVEPTKIIRWDFDELGRVLGCELPHVRKGAGAIPSWTPAAQAAFETAYAPDLQLWAG